MQDPRDPNNDDGRDPSFADPHDPRWSQGPAPAPAPGNQPGPERNPYQDQPLYAPPGTPQNPYLNQPPYPGQGTPGPGAYPQQPMHQRPTGGPAEMEQSNVLGIISMVAGIVGLVTSGMLFLPQLAAIVCGHLSLRREKPRRGFAIAGLVTGYIGLAFGLLLLLGLLVFSVGAFI